MKTPIQKAKEAGHAARAREAKRKPPASLYDGVHGPNDRFKAWYDGYDEADRNIRAQKKLPPPINKKYG